MTTCLIGSPYPNPLKKSVKTFKFMPDYKQLLLKYIQHVSQHEGISFLDEGYELEVFTPEEWKVMQELDSMPVTKESPLTIDDHK